MLVENGVFAVLIVITFIVAIGMGLFIGYRYSTGIDKETAEEIGITYEEFKENYLYKPDHSFWYYVFKK